MVSSFYSCNQIPCTFLHHWHTWLTTIRQFEWMRQIEDRVLWEQLSIFLSFRHISKWSWEVLDAERERFFRCEFICIGVCVLMCVVGIESGPGLICSHHGAQAAGVPVHLQSERAPSYLGKMLSTRVGLPQGSTDIWATPGMSLPIKGQHLAIFISAIKHAAVRGKKGSKCEKRLANDGREGRSWAGISAPAGASSAANATILTQKMMTATPSLYNVIYRSFSHSGNGDP